MAEINGIPVRNDLFNYVQRTELDGVVYQLSFRWNERMELWILDIASVDGVPLLSGVPLVGDFPVTIQFTGRDNIMPGQIVTIDRSHQKLPPDLENFGREAVLAYAEAG